MLPGWPAPRTPAACSTGSAGWTGPEQSSFQWIGDGIKGLIRDCENIAKLCSSSSHPVVEVADVEGRVDDVEAGEDDHDHGGEGDEAPGHEAEAGHGAGPPGPVRGDQPQRGVG